MSKEQQKEAFLGDLHNAASKKIEGLARGTTNLLSGGVTGGGDGGDAAAGKDRNNALMKNLAVGGLAIGGGASALVALVNYLKTLRQEDELEDESRLNDDTLYIPTLGKSAGDLEKEAVSGLLAPGLGVTGGILGAAGSYALVQAVYNHLKKKRHQKMLDEAQGEALAAAEVETQKSANMEKEAAKMGFYDLITAFPVAVPLLAALASGGVAYAALNKTFPTVKRPKSKYPKRIRQVSSTGQVSDYEDEDEAIKSASVIAAESDCEDAANEFLMLMVDQMATEKRASICLVSDILNRAAKDGTLTHLTELQKQGGMEALVEGVKGASDEPATFAERALAAATIVKSARLAPVAKALASAEFQELVPHVYDLSLSMGEERLEKFAGLAPLLHFSYTRPQILEKSAAANPLIEELMQLAKGRGLDSPELMGMDGGIVSQDQQSGGLASADTEEALTTDAVGGMADDSEGDADEDNPLSATEISTSEEDPVDNLLASGGESSPILEPDVDLEEDEEGGQVRPILVTR